MIELLAPAGNMEALVAAVHAGCDAVYLGLEKFGARAYATNFDDESLQEAIRFCHLHNVKIYVTMNTIVFEDELNDAYLQIKKIYFYGVDAIIIQDLALIDYVRTHCPDIEVHASTQMGIDDKEGILFVKSLGVKRAVLGRECSVENIRKIKNETKFPIEVFAHGAHCVSYSGNCLMSGLIGYRSGNRGRCVGSCRKEYELINKTKNKSLGKSYILSMKDLCSIEFLDKLSFVNSLKIEGRMKEPSYVYNVVKHYRYALDNGVLLDDALKNLQKTFNRTYTKGYLFNEDKKYVVNTNKPNHVGYHVGKITKIVGKKHEITLVDKLNQNDIIVVDGKEEVTFPLVKMYNDKGELIKTADKKCYIYMDDFAKVGDMVYVVKDSNYLSTLEKEMNDLSRRIDIDFYLEANIGSPIKLTVVCGDYSVTKESSFIVEKAKSENIKIKEKIKETLSRLKDTPYQIANLEIYVDELAFVPASEINNLRRDVISELNKLRLEVNREFVDGEICKKIDVKNSERNISVYCTTKAQFDAAVELGIKDIYFNNIVKRNEATYDVDSPLTLVGGYGGVNYYKDRDTYLVSDFSLNVVNSKSIYLLHLNGVDRITISHELNRQNIIDMVDACKKYYGFSPNLEMVVYGRAHLLNTKYCPLKVNNLCGECRKNQFTIKDNYGEFPIISHSDCTTTIVNSRTLNLLDELENLPNEITTYRLQFTIESYEEAKEIILLALSRLKGSKILSFNKEKDTRGHFNKEIM